VFQVRTGFVVAGILALSLNCFGQSNQAAISGVVTDPQGGVIPQATVSATDIATGVQTPAVTNSAGYFRLQNLNIGVYNLTVDHVGFRKYIREGVTLTTGQELGLDVKLEVGSTGQSVTVSGQAAAIETRTSELNTLIESKSIDALPLGNRRTLNVVQLSGAAVFVGYPNTPANVTLVPVLASAAPAASVTTASTLSVAAAPGSAAKATAPAAAQAPVTVASTASAPPSTAATSPTSTADGSPQKPAPGTWVAKLHWIPTLLAPRFSGTGESMLAYDVALTNLSIDANKLNISSDKSNITGTVAGGTIALDGWYKDPWGNVNSVKGSLTENGGAFTGQETCYNTQLAASDPTSQTTPHYCKIELSQIR